VGSVVGSTTGDMTIDNFSFYPVINAIVSTSYSSNVITVGGFAPGTAITIIADDTPSALVDAGPFETGVSGNFSTQKDLTVGDSGKVLIVAKATSSNLYSTRVSCTISITSGATTGTGVFAITSEASNAALAPAVVTAPVISGNTDAGSVLTINTGTWTNSPVLYSYQWELDGVPISGATTNSYLTITSQVSHTISCSVTASNAEGSNTASSSNTKIITAATGTTTSPTNTAPPTISGNTMVGSTLSLTSTGSWNPSSGLTFTMQWYRGTALISGATSSTYVSQTADVGNSVKCAVTAFGSGFTQSTTAFSNLITVTTATSGAPVNTAIPVISGNTTVGSSILCTNGVWTNSPTSYSPQWLRNGSPISGAVSTAYTLTPSDSGTTISCRITATNSVGFATATSSGVTITTQIAPNQFSFSNITGVTPGNYGWTPVITVTGLPLNTQVTVTSSNTGGPTGNTLWAGTSSSSMFQGIGSITTTSSSSGTIAIQVGVQTPSGAGGVTIPSTVTIGTTSTTFSVTSMATVDLDPNTYSFTAVTNANISTYYTSNTVTVTGLSPNTQVYVSGGWGTTMFSPAPESPTVDSGTFSLSGTFANSKTVTTSSSGSLVVAVRSLSPDKYNSTWNAAAFVGNGTGLFSITTTTGGVAPVNTGAPSITGSATTGSTLTVSTGTWNNNPTGYTYQWKKNGLNISGATGSSYTVNSGDASSTITCDVTATNTYGSATATSGSVSIGAGVPVNTIAPSLVGTPAVGNTLTVSTGTWTNNPTSYTYQWKKNGSPISGATSSMYLVVSGDASSTILCTVVAINAAGSGTINTGSVTIPASVIDLTPDAFSLGTHILYSTLETFTAVYSSQVTVTGLSPNTQITVSASVGTGGPYMSPTVDAGTSILSGSFATSKTVTTSASGSIVVEAKAAQGPSTYGDTWTINVSVGNGVGVFSILNQVGQ
jgi:hypothetical protein